MTMIATMTMRAMIMGSPGWRTWLCAILPAVGAKQEAQEWAETVRKLGQRNGLTYEAVGGINPKDGPVALCVGGTNRLTGQLVEGFWGACCDADEKEAGGIFAKAVLPTALLAKAHMPDLAEVVPAFN